MKHWKKRCRAITMSCRKWIRLFKPYMTGLSIEDGRFNNELFERLVQRLMFITWQFDMHYSEK